MEIAHIGDEIASRVLYWHDANDVRREVHVRLGKVQSFRDSDDVFVPFQITGLGSERIKYAAGVDGFQAIRLAMKMIGAELDAPGSEFSGRLSWLGSSDLGFGS